MDAATVELLTSEGYDVASIEEVAGGFRVILVIYPFERHGLEKRGIDLKVWRNDAGLTARTLAAKQQNAGFKVWMDYDGPDGYRQYMTDLEAANQDILDLEVVGQTWGTDPQGDGPDTPRDIVALRLTANEGASADGSKPAVLYSSTVHAREWIAGEVNRRLLEWFIKGWREKKPRVINVLRTTELWFVSDPEPRRLPVHVRPAGGPALAEDPPRQRPRRRRPGDTRQPDHAARRRGRQPELPRALEVRRRGVRLARLGRDLPRTLARLGAGDAGARRGARPRAARVPHQLPLVRGAPALPLRLPGEHAVGRRPALRRVGGHGQEAGRAGLRPGGRRRPVHDERGADRLRVLGVRRAEHHARAWATGTRTPASSSPTARARSSTSSRSTSRSRSPPRGRRPTRATRCRR